MGNYDHWGKPKPFSIYCFDTENQTSTAIIAIILLLLNFLREMMIKVFVIDAFIYACMLSHLNGVSSW